MLKHFKQENEPRYKCNIGCFGSFIPEIRIYNLSKEEYQFIDNRMIYVI